MMIRGFGRNEHGLRRLEDLDSEDNEVDETMVNIFCSNALILLLPHAHAQGVK